MKAYSITVDETLMNSFDVHRGFVTRSAYITLLIENELKTHQIIRKEMKTRTGGMI